MKEPMRHLYTIVLVITALMLQACGNSEDNSVFSISANVSEANFSSEVLQESTETIAIQVDFDGDGLVVGYVTGTEPLLNVENADLLPWLSISVENVTENSATIFITANNVIEYVNNDNEARALSLPANTYTTTLRLATSNDDASKFVSHDIDVSFLVWNLTVDTEKVNYSATFGVTETPSKTINISSESNEWTAQTDVSWLSLDVTSGTGDGAIVVTPDVSSFLASGLQQGHIVLTEVTSGDTKLVPVDLALDNIYLFAERPTIALTSTTAISALSTTVTVSNNGISPVDWQASTTADWLTVTKINANQLHVTADPNSAPMNENSSAEVVIAASQNQDVISDTIKVNFYNSELIVENKVLDALAINNNEMLFSPLKPSFYVAIANQLLTYHQYTGEEQASLVVAPEGTSLEQLIIHPNGDYLLAKAIETTTESDPTTGEEVTTEVVHRYRVNLLDNSITKLLDTDILYEPTAIVRLSGRYFVITQALELADDDLQVLFWDGANAYFTTEIDVAAQADTLFALDNNATTKLANLKRYIPQVNDFGDDQISITLTDEYHPQTLGEGQYIRDFVVSNDEKNIYAISETSEWISFDGENFVDNGLLETNTNVVTFFLEKNSDSQANYLRINTANPLGFYLNIYDDQQTISSTIFTGDNLPASIKLSGDDQRLLINVDASNDPAVNAHVELITLSQ